MTSQTGLLMSPDDELADGGPAGTAGERTAETRTDVSIGDLLAAAPPAAAHPEGTSWGPLMVLDEIGHGAFGRVFRAWDPALRHEVALKRFQIPPGTPLAHATTLVREGQMLARIRHENVVTVHGACESQGEVGIWMDFVRGRTLEQLVRADGPMSADEASYVGERLCRALAAVHGAGLLHRDIKASNVMRESGGRIVMLDFGTGTDLDAAGEGRMVGTPLYLAPEIISDGQRASIRSDVYSLGVLLFYLVTGTYPVWGATVNVIRAAHRAGQRRLLIDLRPDLPEAFAGVVERAVASSPDARYATAGALLHDLTAARVASHSRPRALALIAVLGAGAVAALWLSGLITSAAYNVSLGRTGEFAREPLASYWLVGFQALVGPALLILLASLAGAAVIYPLRSILTMAARRSERARTTFSAERLNLLAELLLIVEVVAFAAWAWRFRGMLYAITAFAGSAADDVLAPARSALERRLFGVLLWTMLPAVAAGWIVLLRRGRAAHARIRRGAVAIGLALAGVMVLAWVVPYRLLFQSQAERVSFSGLRCYVIAERTPDALLYCPQARAPRTRAVRDDDPRLIRNNVIESYLDSPD